MTRNMLRLMCELNEGRRSGEEEGYISSDEVRARFRVKSHDTASWYLDYLRQLYKPDGRTEENA